MMRRKELDKVEDNTYTVNQVLVKLKQAKEQWDEFKSNELQHKEDELLDYYNGEIEEGNIPEILENRQKAIKNY